MPIKIIHHHYIHGSDTDKKIDEILAIVKEMKQDLVDNKVIAEQAKKLDESTNKLAEEVKKHTPS